jgi:hypothetical protein
MLEGVTYNQPTISKDIPKDKKMVVKNLYLSNIAEEFVAMQVDMEIPLVISILKEWGVYKGQMDNEKEVTLVNHRV